MSGFDAHMLYVLIIMLLAGILGGYANYFLREGAAGAEPADWIKYPVLGVVVALTAPLFLNMISSNLVDAARTRASDYLVLGGFCLVYVVASRRLVENAANRVLSQVEAVKRELARMRQSATTAPILQRPADPPVDAQARNEPPRENLTHVDVELLRVIGEESIVYGNLAALSERTGVPRELVGQRLAILKSWGVIESRISDKNMLHWAVAPKGRQMLLDLIGGGDDKRAGQG